MSTHTAVAGYASYAKSMSHYKPASIGYFSESPTVKRGIVSVRWTSTHPSKNKPKTLDADFLGLLNSPTCPSVRNNFLGFTRITTPATKSKADLFLNKTPGLALLVGLLETQIRHIDSVLAIERNYYLDPDEGFERLFLEITTDLKEDEAIDNFEDVVMDQFIKPIWPLLQNKIVISVS
jgi:hypothetical protein